MRHVRASDQMHKKDRAHYEQRERSEVRYRFLAERQDMHATTAICVRVRGGNTSCDRFQLGARLLDRNAFLDLAYAVQKEVPPRIILFIHLEGHPEVANFREPPALWHHTDDRDLLAIDWDRFAHNRAIAREMILPNLVTDQRHRRGIELIFFRSEEAANDGLNPEERKCVRRKLPT